MKFLLLLSAFAFYFSPAFAQEYVFDPQYFSSVMANQAVRMGAEQTHDQYLDKINTNIEDINTNVGSVVLAQTMIYLALSNVNSVLKDGLEVKNMTATTADMINYLNQALALAKSEPYLLLVASSIENEMRLKAVALVSEVSGFVLKQGDNILADFSVRDELLKKITQQLQMLDGLAYGTWRVMFWAKENGYLKTLNPYADYIGKDKLFVQQIIQNAKYLQIPK